ncbi:Jerky-like protein [Smittium mucronatum]|uniref:Jerky-like protein n=1 Tax=Smittium mucronatum TaxID=133383 RepID=A0A1R0H150_9FUNG|nr:Jerky-like protein [Smittium mucronatum]
MIGRSKNPTCIRGKKFPIPYFKQENAWIDTIIFKEWFSNVFKPFVKRFTEKKVLLLLDNVPGNASAFEDNGIRVIFFPPNVTSWKQPMVMGIIGAFKKGITFY